MLKHIYDKVDKTQLYKWCAVLSTLLAIEIVATILIPTWREYFFNGIENKSYSAFYNGLFYFVILMGSFIISQGFKRYSGQRLALIWRTGITKVLQKKWCRNLEQYQAVDNPDQRINEDAKIASDLAVEVVIETLISFAIIVGLMIQIQNTLLFVLSMAYTALAILIALLFKKPMVDTEITLQKKEADHRFSLASIVMGRGDYTSKAKYTKVCSAYLQYIKVYLHYTLFHSTKMHLTSIIPLLVLVPLYFAGDITFGSIMKGISEFELLVINSTILLILYPKITKTIASYHRISTFYHTAKKED